MSNKQEIDNELQILLTLLQKSMEKNIPVSEGDYLLMCASMQRISAYNSNVVEDDDGISESEYDSEYNEEEGENLEVVDLTAEVVDLTLEDEEEEPTVSNRRTWNELISEIELKVSSEEDYRVPIICECGQTLMNPDSRVHQNSRRHRRYIDRR